MTGPRRPQPRGLAAVIVLCSLALAAPLAWPLLTGRIFAFTDLGFFHLPMRAIYQQSLRSGDSLLWTPSLFAGYYVHGEGQSGIFHPLHLVLYRWLPLGIAFNLEFLASYVAAFAGMYWFGRRLALAPAAALFGAMLFAFSGFQLLHFLHINLVAVVAHLPWLLASIDLLLAAENGRSRALGFVAVAGVIASAVLIGFQQAVWWDLLAGTAFALFRAAQLARWRRLAACAAAGLAGIATGGVQLLPTLDMAVHSVRAGIPRSFALMYSLHPYNALQLWSPYVFRNRVFDPIDYPWVHELGIYSGALLLLAPFWIAIRRPARAQQWATSIFLVVFAVVAFVLALGRYGGLDVLLTYLPGVGSFRAPVRYIVLVQFALAALAAIVFDDLITRGTAGVRFGRRDLLLLVPALLSLATLALVTTRMLPLRRLPLATASHALPGLLLVLTVTVLFVLAARATPGALLALVLVTAGDLGWWGIRHIYTTPLETVAHQTEGIRPVPDPAARYAAPDNWGNRLLLEGYRMSAGYVGLYPLTRLPYGGVPFLRLAGTQWSFITGGPAPLAGALPRVRLLRDARVSADPGDDVNGVDLAQTALVSNPIGPLGGTPGTARLLVDRPGRLVIATMADGRQLLAIGERFHEGWIATTDGRPQAVEQINGDFMGCVLDAGTHRVELRFAPRSFTHGWQLTLAGIAAVAIGAIFMSREP